MVSDDTKNTRKWWVLAGATLLFLATTSDGPNFNAALPAIQEYFNANAGQVQFLITTTQLCVAAFVLAAGSLGDLYGRKRILLFAGLGLIVSLVLQAISPSMTFLTVVRGLDGVFSAIIMPLAVVMITLEFEDRQRGLALGIFTAIVGLGEAFLPLLSGKLVDTVGWRFTFLISITAIILAYIIIHFKAAESKDPNEHKLDVGGMVLSAIAMVCILGSFLIVGSRGFTDPIFILTLAAGIVFLLIFIRWEKRVPNPALQLELFKNTVFRSAFLAGFGMFFVMMPISVLMQTYFQGVMEYSAYTASVAMVPFFLGTTISGPFAGRLEQHIGRKKAITLGIIIMFLGVGLLTSLGALPPYWIVGLGLGLVAIGFGLTNPTRIAALMSSASDEIAGTASSANSVGMESGSGAGIALCTSLAVIFVGRAFINLGTKAGLSPEQVQNAVEVLRKAMSDSLSPTHPPIPQSTLDQLLEGGSKAIATGISQTLILLTIVCALSGLIVWFGMRNQKAEIDAE